MNPNQNTTIEIEITEKRLLIKMPKNETDIQFLRKFKFVRWDSNLYKWIIPNYGENLELLKSYFNTRIAKIDTNQCDVCKPEKNITDVLMNQKLAELDLQALKEIGQFKYWMEHKRYSKSTVKTYVGAITVFLRFIKPKTSAEATNEDMRRFVYQYMIPRKLSFSYQNQAVNAAKLF